MGSTKAIEDSLASLGELIQSPLDILPHQEFAEKLIYLELQGAPPGLPNKVATALQETAANLSQFDVQNLRVVVLGGGTGLSNIIGGDSRNEMWADDPFRGLKEIFPQTKAIVCVTDDGGSTGELLKDLPFIALGDLRHVLLSLLRKQNLRARYNFGETESLEVAKVLHRLFNYRFDTHPGSIEALCAAAGLTAPVLPKPMHAYFAALVELLFTVPELEQVLTRPHCLGNLLLAAAIWQDAVESSQKEREKTRCDFHHANDYHGLNQMCRVMALDEDAILPCSLTPAGLQVLYSNGILVTGEYKSSHARRGYPVDRVFVNFVEEPRLPAELINSLEAADIIILAPGSLYTSTIPILQVPGIAEAIRNNIKALKILVANLWVQKGETDVVRNDPKRRFHVSDLITAYNRNIPGGVAELFCYVLSLALQDIPGSILQNYAMEDKIPILLDREKVREMGFKPIEAGISSQTALQQRGVIQHDPAMLGRAIRTLVAANSLLQKNRFDQKIAGKKAIESERFSMKQVLVQRSKLYPCERYKALKKWVTGVKIMPDTGKEKMAESVLDILWHHQDIPLSHLDNINALGIIGRSEWPRSQEWDNVFSFFDPLDSTIKVCQDVIADDKRFEQAFLVALGQALLGNYADKKEMKPLEKDGETVGKMYCLTIKPLEERNSFLTEEDLSQYLKLARMIQSESNSLIFTRMVNGNEGFTPPGLLFGLIYAWYLDNRLAAHVEYKMAVMRTDISDLIPEQVRVFKRRRALAEFFRRAVFCHSSRVYDEIIN